MREFALPETTPRSLLNFVALFEGSCFPLPVASPLESVVSQLTIADLARAANLSVEQVVELVLGSQPSSSPKPPSRPAPARGSKPQPSAPRARPGTPTDDDVLAAVLAAGGPIGASDLRSQVGGTPAELRAALHRLRDAGRIRVQGQRRSTRYSAAR